MKNIYKFTYLFTLFLLFSLPVFAQNVYIPDANFKAVLVRDPEINTNGDGEIQKSEAEAFTGTIRGSYAGIKSLTGLEAFPNIYGIEVMNNLLTNVDVTNNGQLATLVADVNMITKMKLGSSTNLYWISIYGNEMDACALDDLYRQLPDRTSSSVPGQLYLRNLSTTNPGAETSTTSIAEAKNWKIMDLNKSCGGPFQFYGDGTGCVPYVNKAPIANAGVDMTVYSGANVTLNGTASSDPDGDAITYQWTAPVGITLTSPTSATPTFTAPAVTADTPYTFSLTVSDGKLVSAVDQVVVTVKPTVNRAPIANAGIDQTVNEGALVTLNGSASTDADGDALTYLWTAPAGITLTGSNTVSPSFTAPQVSAETPYTFTLVVSDGKLSSAPDQVVITVKNTTPVNQPPVADAGPNQSVDEGKLVTLDGSKSYDPEGMPITYKWTAPQGITLNSATVVNPTFTAPAVSVATSYVFSLVVNDGVSNSQVSQVIVIVQDVPNQIPVAVAGPDQMVDENTLVTLDGSASSDPDGDAITYLWTAPEGITLSARNVAKPTFTAPSVAKDTTFIFSLIVGDSKSTSKTDQVAITVRNTNLPPVANAGQDSTANEGTQVILNGMASSDPNGDKLTYSWTAPEGIVLSSTAVANPSFTAPEVKADTTFTFALTVSDGYLTSAPDTVRITVLHVNKAPIANAGPNQTVNRNLTVTLDGSASYDPDGDAITYQWTAPEGITLSSNTAVKPTFTAPAVNARKQLTFELIVNDGTLSSAKDYITVTVEATNNAPVAVAGDDLAVNEKDTVSLDGSQSYDPDNDAITYKWTAPQGIELMGDTTAKPEFTAPEVSKDSTFLFTLVVNDGQLNSAPDTVYVLVRNASYTNSTAAEIKVNGAVLADFDPKVTEYYIELAENATIPEISVIPTGDGSTVEVIPATTIPGTTQVIVTAQDGVTKTVYLFNFKRTNTSTALWAEQLKMYPVPATSVLNIHIPASIRVVHMEVYNAAGKRMDVQAVPAIHTVIDVQRFTPGLYFVRLTNDRNETVTLKFIRK